MECKSLIFFTVGPGGASSEESAESSEEDGLPSGHRGSVATASGANNGQQHSIRQPITTLLGHQVRYPMIIKLKQC
jgi:hypothetical protein